MSVIVSMLKVLMSLTAYPPYFLPCSSPYYKSPCLLPVLLPSYFQDFEG